MKDRHITDILDGKRFAELSAEETALVAAHASGCADCERAVAAARLSSLMFKLQAGAPGPEPSVFFQAKVMNALRAKHNRRKPMAALRRWWQASYAMVCVMLATVAALIGLTALAPATGADETQAVVPNNLYTTDAVIMNQRSPREMSDEQVFRVIYNPRYETNQK
jgi:hypothetical protein